MIETHKLTVGALYRKGWMVRMDELGIPYKEHRTLVDSVIIVQLYTAEQVRAYKGFRSECIAFIRRLEALERREEQEELAEKLARKNRFRRLTFRKPLTSLK